MLTFGVLAEGYTDQIVVEALLLGVFAGAGEEPEINFVRPRDGDPDADGNYPAGSWTVLFHALEQGEHRQALQNNDYVVIHVDTDVCEDAGFGVPRVDPPEVLIDAVRARLIGVMGAEDFDLYRERVLFAIAVDATECWLLPILFPTHLAKRKKITGCLECAERQLRLEKRPRLRSAKGKNPPGYSALAKVFRKRRKLMALKGLNPSLRRFVDAIEEVRLRLVAAAAQAEAAGDEDSAPGASAAEEARSS